MSNCPSCFKPVARLEGAIKVNRNPKAFINLSKKERKMISSKSRHENWLMGKLRRLKEIIS